ncbi:DUF421 domain-containing protein [Niallia sp. JL1B1071]|uniref:DUF421 domain-containing protein n=1 Tax=Niallia tiangongensis TaxID=3237105 RepID=UPI0037DD56B3
MSFIWQSMILILCGILLLRLAGRKSISQMTLAQTVIMISLGTIIVQPIVEKSTFKAIISAGIFVVTILILEFLQLKSNRFEKFITGKSKVVINNGQLNMKELKKLRLTVDQLEMRLRNHGISKIEEIKNATIEANGQLGFEYMENAKPLTVGEFQKIMHTYFPYIQNPNSTQTMRNNNNIFSEINEQDQDNPKWLQ